MMIFIRETARLPDSCKLINIFGTGIDTPLEITYGSEDKPLLSLTWLADGKAEAKFSVMDGDGTVPAASASADGLSAFQVRRPTHVSNRC